MNREFLTRVAAMARRIGALPFLQKMLPTSIVRTTKNGEQLAEIIRSSQVVEHPERKSQRNPSFLPVITETQFRSPSHDSHAADVWGIWGTCTSFQRYIYRKKN
jgi:hypothetical protein